MRKRGHQDFNNVLREYLHRTIPPIFQAQLGLPVGTRFEPLGEDKVHRTISRDPDFLQFLLDDEGRRVALVHLEVHVKDELKITFRCCELDALKAVEHELPIRTAVVFLGNGRSKNIAERLDLGSVQYQLTLINIHELPFEAFLHSSDPAEVLWGILADFGKNQPAEAIRQLLYRLATMQLSSEESNYYAKQLSLTFFDNMA